MGEDVFLYLTSLNGVVLKCVYSKRLKPESKHKGVQFEPSCKMITKLNTVQSSIENK